MKFEANTKYYIPNEEDQVRFQEACFEQGIYWGSEKTHILDNLGPWFFITEVKGGKLIIHWDRSGEHLVAYLNYTQIKYPSEPTRPPSPKPEKVVLETIVKYGYNLPTLTQEQVEWLHGVMQNPLWGQELEDEEEHHKDMRNFFFDISYMEEL